MATAPKTYLVRWRTHNPQRLWLAGTESDGSPIWSSDKADAVRYTRKDAARLIAAYNLWAAEFVA